MFQVLNQHRKKDLLEHNLPSLHAPHFGVSLVLNLFDLPFGVALCLLSSFSVAGKVRKGLELYFHIFYSKICLCFENLVFNKNPKVRCGRLNCGPQRCPRPSPWNL